jgi:hypothetical protein
VLLMMTSLKRLSPTYVTEHVILSPGLTGKPTISNAGSGNSSKKAKYTGVPPLQSWIVPICSTVGLLNPSIPTHVEQKVAPVLTGPVIVGTVNVPRARSTVLMLLDEEDRNDAYPLQFKLLTVSVVAADFWPLVARPEVRPRDPMLESEPNMATVQAAGRNPEACRLENSSSQAPINPDPAEQLESPQELDELLDEQDEDLFHLHANTIATTIAAIKISTKAPITHQNLAIMID